MISINSNSATSLTVSSLTMTDLPVASCLLGLSNPGTGLFGLCAVRPESVGTPTGFAIRERDERPIQAPAAVVAEAQAHAYAALAAGAGSRKQTKQQYMWAFRGLEPWSDPA